MAEPDRGTARGSVPQTARRRSSGPSIDRAPDGRTRQAPPTGRDALRRHVARLSYREGAQALRPPEAGTVQATVASRPPNTAIAPDPPERDAARDELQRWYSDAKDAIQATRNQMGRAADRFAAFSGSSIRSLKARASVAGSLATLLFGPKGRIANLLAGLIVDAVAKDPGPGLRAEMARRLDDEARIADLEVTGRYESLHLEVVSASTAETLRKARDDIRAARPGLLPTENQLYRDLLLDLALDANMHLDGSAFNLRHEGRWWSSLQPSRPFALDGGAVADELNALDRADSHTRKNFDTERLR